MFARRGEKNHKTILCFLKVIYFKYRDPNQLKTNETLGDYVNVCSSNCKKCTILAEDVDNGGGYASVRVGGIQEVLYLPLNFLVNLK